MKTNIDEPCAGNLQARFFRGSCSNKTQTRGVKLQLLPNRFSKEKRKAFNKSFYELLENSFKNINEKDEKGETILHKAARMSTRKKVSFLVRKGADVNATDNRGFTPLHWAASAKRLENVKELIREGAAVNATEGMSKYTPLHLACIVGAESVIKELVKARADVNQPDKFGNTPMYWLLENEKNKKARKFLEKQGSIVRDRPEICDEIVESVGEMVDVWSRKFLPKLKGKVVSLEEIRKRDESLIIEDFNKVISRVVGKMNTMIKEFDER